MATAGTSPVRRNSAARLRKSASCASSISLNGSRAPAAARRSSSDFGCTPTAESELPRLRRNSCNAAVFMDALLDFLPELVLDLLDLLGETNVFVADVLNGHRGELDLAPVGEIALVLRVVVGVMNRRFRKPNGTGLPELGRRRRGTLQQLHLPCVPVCRPF